MLTSFVGREQAVREVASLLEEYRLVTVTGPGGVGKTRLAGEIARRLAARFADGVWLAELARYAVRVAEQAAAELRTIAGEPAAARWLDAEDTALAYVLARAWSMTWTRRCGW